MQEFKAIVNAGTCSKPIAWAFITATIIAQTVQVGIQSFHGSIGHGNPSDFIALQHQAAEDPVRHDPWIPVVHRYCSAHPLVTVAIFQHWCKQPSVRFMVDALPDQWIDFVEFITHKIVCHGHYSCRFCRKKVHCRTLYIR